MEITGKVTVMLNSTDLCKLEHFVGLLEFPWIVACSWFTVLYVK